MKIVVNSTINRNLETLLFESIDNLHENFKKLLTFKGPLEVKIYAINELITSNQLSRTSLYITFDSIAYFYLGILFLMLL